MAFTIHSLDLSEKGPCLKRNGHPLKPSSPVQPGDLLEIPFIEGPGLRRVAVKAVIVKRVGAPEAQACCEDLTSPEIYVFPVLAW